MKQVFKYIIFIFCIVNLTVNNASTKNIITTIKPIDSIVSNIVGEKFETQYLIQKGNPHNYNLTIADIKMINNSKLLILINREFEWFLKDILESKKNEIKLLELSNYDQIKFLESTHAHHEEKEHHEEDDHYEEDDEHYDHEAMIDFHIWLSPTNALAIGEIITIKLSEIDPENKFFYLDNLLVFEKKILALNTKIRKMFNKKKIANYIVLHDAYQYFEDEFEIENEIAIKFDSHQENTIKDIIEIRKILRDKDIKCIFSDGVSDKKLLNILNKDFDLKIIELDHLGDNFDKNKSLYFKLIESLANSFLECR